MREDGPTATAVTSRQAFSDVERAHSRRVVVSVVDGSRDRLKQVSTALNSFYRVASYHDTDTALYGLKGLPPCALLIDEVAPPVGGLAFLQFIRSERVLQGVPVIFISNNERTCERAKELGAEVTLLRPFRRSQLIRAISGRVNVSIEQKWEELPPVERDALKSTAGIFNTLSDVIDTGTPITYADVSEACGPLVEAVTMKQYHGILEGVREHDNYSYAHSLGTSTMLLLFGQAIGLKESDLKVLGTGGLLHDVGKMSIPHEVLNKPGKLSDQEFAIMKGHVGLTVDYLEHCPDMPKGVRTIAQQHHEKLDGSGYPQGLKGTQLNDLARMASIVDVFGALTDRRIYKPPMTAERALGLMAEEMTGKLDQHFLLLFREVLMDARKLGQTRCTH